MVKKLYNIFLLMHSCREGVCNFFLDNLAFPLFFMSLFVVLVGYFSGLKVALALFSNSPPLKLLMLKIALPIHFIMFPILTANDFFEILFAIQSDDFFSYLSAPVNTPPSLEAKPLQILEYKKIEGFDAGIRDHEPLRSQVKGSVPSLIASLAMPCFMAIIMFDFI